MWAQAAYDPPRQVSTQAAAEPAALLRQLLPAGATLLHPPLALPFGAHEQGTLLVLALAGPPKGYAVWYLTAAEEPGQTRLIRLRDPEPADEFIDISVRAAFAFGEPGDKHIVLLDSASRTAPAGGMQQQGGSVWRKVGGSALRLNAESQRLTDVRDAAAARVLLAPLINTPNPALLRGTLPAAFLSLPVQQVDLTRRERIERVRVGSRWMQLNDPANGFLDIRGDAGLPGYQLALFKRSGQGQLIALQRRYTEGQRTWFLQREGDGWRDVSTELVPGYRPELPYTLPRSGTRLEQAGQTLAWTGARFEAR